MSPTLRSIFSSESKNAFRLQLKTRNKKNNQMIMTIIIIKTTKNPQPNQS